MLTNDIIKIFESPKYAPFNELVGTDDERYGYKFEPVEVDVSLQFQAINEINLNEEFFDATVVLRMSWKDETLEWKTGTQDKTATENINAVLNNIELEIRSRTDKTPTINSIRVTEDEVRCILDKLYKRIFIRRSGHQISKL